MTAPPTAAPVAGIPISERTQNEKRLGWKLTAPAVIVMLAVTAYPMINAVWLSLFSYRLTDPTARSFVGLRNYGVVLTDSLWWQDVFTTVIITVITVVSAFAWKYAFSIDTGFINNWFGLGSFAWFGHRWSSLFVICMSEIWKTTPFMSLLLLAGLAQVPEDLQAAAKVDGATWGQRLSRVTL